MSPQSYLHFHILFAPIMADSEKQKAGVYVQPVNMNDTKHDIVTSVCLTLKHRLKSTHALQTDTSGDNDSNMAIQE